jgi:hypothetical protein
MHCRANRFYGVANAARICDINTLTLLENTHVILIIIVPL